MSPATRRPGLDGLRDVVVAAASLDTALAMLLPGARSTTASQVGAILHAPTSPALFERAPSGP